MSPGLESSKVANSSSGACRDQVRAEGQLKKKRKREVKLR